MEYRNIPIEPKFTTPYIIVWDRKTGKLFVLTCTVKIILIFVSLKLKL